MDNKTLYQKSLAALGLEHSDIIDKYPNKKIFRKKMIVCLYLRGEKMISSSEVAHLFGHSRRNIFRMQNTAEEHYKKDSFFNKDYKDFKKYINGEEREKTVQLY